MAHVRNSRSRGTPRASQAPAKPGFRRNLGTKKGAGAHVRRGGLRVPATATRTPRQERATRTLEAIVTAAERLLVDIGYAATSTNAIAERAGVSIGSLYQYFSDKDDVFRAVVARHRREVMPVIAEMLERMRAPGSDLVDSSLELLRRMAAVNSKNPRLLAAIDCELGWLEREDDMDADALEAVTSILTSRLSHHPYPAEVTATLLVTLMEPLSRWMVHGKPASLDSEALISAFGCMLRGLLEAQA